jgi:hypothetical protein
MIPRALRTCRTPNFERHAIGVGPWCLVNMDLSALMYARQARVKCAPWPDVRGSKYPHSMPAVVTGRQPLATSQQAAPREQHIPRPRYMFWRKRGMAIDTVASNEVGTVRRNAVAWPIGLHPLTKVCHHPQSGKTTPIIQDSFEYLLSF